MEEILREIFAKLNEIFEDENLQRRNSGAGLLKKAKVLLLGQMSLLVDPKVVATLTLAQTGDMDAKLEMDYFLKAKLKELLDQNGLVYDEDSDKVFIPKNSKEIELFKFKNVLVNRLDPESVLVSKAIKALEKNRPLIIDGTASDIFPNLLSRIEEEGGNLEHIFGGTLDD